MNPEDRASTQHGYQLSPVVILLNWMDGQPVDLDGRLNTKMVLMQLAPAVTHPSTNLSQLHLSRPCATNTTTY